MPTHWTYDECPECGDLMQGDILSPTEELRLLFREVHPHFCDEKYLAFIVISQSCDLARHRGICAARYINVAAVRSLSAVLFRLLDTVCERLDDGIYVSGTGLNRARDLLERIFNQNEQKLGLFYLYPDGDIGIGEDAVAFLRVSVAFRVDHYDVMRNARRGRLRPEFANKLGWLVGNMYSRAATPDWPAAQLKDRLKDYLISSAPESPVWVDERNIRELRREKGTTPSRQELLELAKKKAQSFREAGISLIIRHVEATCPAVDEKSLEILRSRLRNDAALMSSFKG